MQALWAHQLCQDPTASGPLRLDGCAVTIEQSDDIFDLISFESGVQMNRTNAQRPEKRPQSSISIQFLIVWPGANPQGSKGAFGVQFDDNLIFTSIGCNGSGFEFEPTAETANLLP